MKIIYLPLEPLKERYTIQLSAAKTGWLERRWNQGVIPYLRIEGKQLNKEIKAGSVLDANGRGYWACSQIMEVLRLLNAGEITKNDVLYFDDFWHPGISALPYSFHLTGIHPKMFAMLHAQTVDPYDFTYPMRHWMRHFEIGIGKVLDGIFVTSTCLRDMLLYAGIGTENTVHLTGLPYNSEEVKEHWPADLPKKKNQIVFSSRWDREKRPDVFLDIVDFVLRQRPDVTFVVTTSFNDLRSNDRALVKLFHDAQKRHPKNLELRVNQTKEQYYQTLLESKIQINTADQDFVSWTLLEATTCGCIPLYPCYLSFPEALQDRHEHMYPKNDVKTAAGKVVKFLDANPTINDFKWVYKAFDRSWERMYRVMLGETI